MRRIVAFFYFLVSFLREFLKANLSVAYIALFVSNEKIHPKLINYDVTELRRNEILMMAQLITLTPGTIAVEIDLDSAFILIHMLDASNPEKTLGNIDKKIKDPLLGVTRC